MEVLDTRGLRCPKPMLKISVIYAKSKQGDVLELIGDCPTFEAFKCILVLPNFPLQE